MSFGYRLFSYLIWPHPAGLPDNMVTQAGSENAKAAKPLNPVFRSTAPQPPIT